MPSRRILIFCIMIKIILSSDQPPKLPTNNLYGENYGTKWVLFPDGNGSSHYVHIEGHRHAKFVSFSEFEDYKIEYRLYTRKDPYHSILLDNLAHAVNATDTPLVTGAPIKLVTHGWMSSANTDAIIAIKDEYLKSFNYNVILVDWSETAKSLLYPIVALKTKHIGMAVGNFVDSLNERYKVTGDQIHLIGHSLGAHVMGNAGSATKLHVSRITGLDPARPLYEIPPAAHRSRLDKSDAKLVDVIHTCRGILGFLDAIGHMDFYPNNGFAPQPGCDGHQLIFESCSHSLSMLFFAESINNPKAFQAVQCDSWEDFLDNKECKNYKIFMGENVTKNVPGIFYLRTNPSTPYGLVNDNNK